MPLIRNGAAADDTFVTVADGDALPANGAIVTLARFKSERDALLARNAPLGVWLKSAESPEELGDDVHRLSVIVLEFPIFRDGRPFSWARMLRTRMGFTGEIRATGHFLYDQLAFLARTGRKAEAQDLLVEIDRRIARADPTFRKEARTWRALAAEAIG